MFTDIINREAFEFTCSAEDTAITVQHNIEAHLIPQFNDIISSVLSRGAQSNDFLKIDRIEIDLGDINIYDLDKGELLFRFREKFLEEITNQQNKNYKAGPGNKNDDATVSSEIHNELELIRTFMLFGDVPWWVNKNDVLNIDSIVQKLLLHHPEALKKLLEEHIVNPDVLLRLSTQIKRDTLSKIGRIIPGLSLLLLKKGSFDEIIPGEINSLSGEHIREVKKIFRKHAPGSFQKTRHLLTDLLMQLYRSVHANEMSIEGSALQRILRQLGMEPLIMSAKSRHPAIPRDKKNKIAATVQELTVFETELVLFELSGYFIADGLSYNHSGTLKPAIQELAEKVGENIQDKSTGDQWNDNNNDSGSTPLTGDRYRPVKDELNKEYTREEGERGDLQTDAGSAGASDKNVIAGKKSEGEQDPGFDDANGQRSGYEENSIAGLKKDAWAPGNSDIKDSLQSPEAGQIAGINKPVAGTVREGEQHSGFDDIGDQPSVYEANTTPGLKDVSPSGNSDKKGPLQSQGEAEQLSPVTKLGGIARTNSEGEQKPGFNTIDSQPPIYEADTIQGSKDLLAGGKKDITDPLQFKEEAEQLAGSNKLNEPGELKTKKQEDAFSKMVNFIMRRLKTTDLFLLQYLQGLNKKQLEHLTAIFKKRVLENMEHKQIINRLLEHPSLLKNNILKVFAYVSPPKEQSSGPGFDKSTKKGSKKDSKKDHFGGIIAGKIPLYQFPILSPAKQFSPGDFFIMKDILQKERFDTDNEKRVVKKLLLKLSQENILLLKFLTGLSPQDIEKVLPSPQYTSLPAAALSTRENDPGYAEIKGKNVHIENAGLCLLAVYFPGFFKQLKYLEEGKFKTKHFAIRAMYVLQYLVSGNTKRPEYLLQFNKLLCSFQMEEQVITSIRLTKKEIEEADNLIDSVIKNWKTLKSTSIQGFRESFLKRKGILFESNTSWTLRVEKKGFDVLLDSIPWSFNIIKLPWMKKFIHVEW